MSHPVGGYCSGLIAHLVAVKDDFAAAHLGDELQELGVGKLSVLVSRQGVRQGLCLPPGLLMSPLHARLPEPGPAGAPVIQPSLVLPDNQR